MPLSVSLSFLEAGWGFCRMADLLYEIPEKIEGTLEI